MHLYLNVYFQKKVHSGSLSGLTKLGNNLSNIFCKSSTYSTEIQKWFLRIRFNLAFKKGLRIPLKIHC